MSTVPEMADEFRARFPGWVFTLQGRGSHSNARAACWPDKFGAEPPPEEMVLICLGTAGTVDSCFKALCAAMDLREGEPCSTLDLEVPQERWIG